MAKPRRNLEKLFEPEPETESHERQQAKAAHPRGWQGALFPLRSNPLINIAKLKYIDTIPLTGGHVSEGPPTFEQAREAWRASTKAMLRAIPGEWTSSIKELAAANHEFRQALMRRFESDLDVYLRAANPKDAESKKLLSVEVNELLEKLGLAICCPITKQSSFLHVIPASEKNPYGRFEIRPKGLSKATITRARLSDLLPLQLVDAHPRREALAEWHRRVKEQGGHASGVAK